MYLEEIEAISCSTIPKCNRQSIHNTNNSRGDIIKILRYWCFRTLYEKEKRRLAMTGSGWSRCCDSCDRRMFKENLRNFLCEGPSQSQSPVDIWSHCTRRSDLDLGISLIFDVCRRLDESHSLTLATRELQNTKILIKL